MTCVYCQLLVVLLLGAWLGSALPPNTGRIAKCVIHNALPVSEYVSAWHQLTAANVTGCRSRQLATAGQQVVVVHYTGPPSNITVHLRTDAGDEEEDVSSVLLVLISTPTPPHQPAHTWRLTTFRLSRGHLSSIHVSGGGQVSKERKLKASVSKLHVDGDDVIGWIRQHYGGVTSYVHVTQPANHVDVLLSSEVAGVSEACVPQSVAQSSAGQMTVSTVMPVPVDGCVVPVNRGRDDKDVHIIELVPSSGTDSSVKPVVTVNIGVVSRSSVQVHLVLVLQSQHSVQWRLLSQGIRGMVDIITDDPVDADDVDVNSLRVAAERLRAYTRSTLVEWVQDKYGAPVSYTRAHNANLWHLTIDPDLSWSSHHSLPVTATVVKAGALQATLPKLSSVTCAKTGLTVALRRDLLENFGVRRNQLSLVERSCGATENSTHFLLHTSATDCGSRLDVSDSAIVYVNKVLIYRRVAGGSVVVAAQLDVQCTTDILTPTKAAEVAPVQQPMYEMSLYADKYSSIVLLPAEVAADRTLFVEAVLVQLDSGMGLSVDKCWLSVVPESPAHLALYWNIVTSGCADVSTLRWHDADVTGEWRLRRFSFSLDEFDVLNKTVDVSCEVSLCAADDRHPTMPRCQHQDAYCLSQAHQGSTGGLWPTITRLPGHLTVVEQPLPPHLLSTTPASFVAPVEQQSEDEPCQTQVTRLIGLDMKMVVVVAFSAFIIGVMLMATVWLIHTRTGRQYQQQRLSRKTMDSGASTTASLVPFLVHPVHS